MSGLSSGPAPNPNRRRRNATLPMTALPASGRTGPIPKWPLGPDVTTAAKLRVAEAKVERLEEQAAAGRPVASALTRAQERLEELRAVVDIQAGLEQRLWRELWRLPQAVAWERSGWLREVAQYTRWKVLAESGDLDAAKEARQLSDRLGLSPLAMLRLRWEIRDQPVARSTGGGAGEGGAAVVTDIAAAPSRRSRLS